MKYKVIYAIGLFLFRIFRIFSIKRNKIVATTMRGRKFGDNPKYIVEKLHEMRPDLDIVWFHTNYSNYITSEGIRQCNYNNPISRIYELATAKVWINSHRIEGYVRKRKGQLFIETWHGGLAIKKLELDRDIHQSEYSLNEVKNTRELADVFVSNCDFLDNVYHSGFGYNGPILKVGYPRSDILFKKNEIISKEIRDYFNLNEKVKICLYAPTFRDSFMSEGTMDLSVYDVDFCRLKKALEDRFAGKWAVLLKWHPVLAKYVKENSIKVSDVIDATEYPDMQKLLLGVDAVLSDYSSSLFDGAMREIPCFIYAKDFEEYKGGRGVYFELEELPFSNAKDNDELVKNIINYNHDVFIQKWHAFKEKTGLKESGHATEIIAQKVLDFIDGKAVDWSK